MVTTYHHHHQQQQQQQKQQQSITDTQPVLLCISTIRCTSLFLKKLFDLLHISLNKDDVFLDLMDFHIFFYIDEVISEEKGN